VVFSEPAFDDKGERALVRALPCCMVCLVSLSSMCCLVNSAEIWGQKKHAQVLLQFPDVVREVKK
jgi:hypothetical protein